MSNTPPTGPGGKPAPQPKQSHNVTVPATVESTHQMMIAIIIFICVGFLLIILAGESATIGNSIAGLLLIMLIVQGFSHVSPIAEFFVKHPLKPKTK